MDFLDFNPSTVLIGESSLLISEKLKVEEQLQQNENEIEQCICGIEMLIEGLPSLSGRDDISGDLEALLTAASSSHAIEKTACYDLDTEKVQQMLTALNEYLHKNPGNESMVLTHLIEYSSQTGITLPFKSPDTNRTTRGSVISLNVVNDEEDRMCDALWDEIRRVIKDRLLDSLYMIPLDSLSILHHSQRRDLLKKLELLTDKTSLFNQYKQLRICALNDLINTQLSDVGSGDVVSSFSLIVKSFSTVFQVVLSMIESDFILFSSGAFKKVTTWLDGVTGIYFDKLISELEPILEELASGVIGQTNNRRPSFGGKLKPPRSKSQLHTDKMNRSESNQFVKALPDEIVTDMLVLTRSLTTVETLVQRLYLLTHMALRGASTSNSLSSVDTIRSVLKSTSVTDVSILSDSINGPEDFSDADLTSLNSARRLLSDSGPVPQVVDSPGYKNAPTLAWSRILDIFVPSLSAAIGQRVTNAADKCATQLKCDQKPAIINVCLDRVGGKMENPVSVWKAVSEFVSVIDNLFSLIESSQSSQTLTQITQDFIDVSVTRYKLLLQIIQDKISELVPVKCGLQLILKALSSVAFLRNSLYQLHTRINKLKDMQNGYLLVYHQYCRCVDSFAQQYVASQLDNLTTALLHDSSAYNWTECKEYFEGERCSAPIQMWNFRLRTIQVELWSSIPPSNSAAMLADILKQTLDNITLRYLQVMPSYRRLEQYRLDITCILHVSKDMLFYITHTVNHILDVELSALEQPYLSIHSNCCKLLASMAIVTCPLELLYKTYKKGYQRKQKRRRTSNPASDTAYHSKYSHWLSWIDKDTFPRGQARYRDMQTTTALNIQLLMFYSQCEADYNMMIQALVMKSLTLSLMLATQPNIQITTRINQQTQSGCSGASCSMSCQYSTHVETILEPLLLVVSECSIPSALYNIITALITNNNQWETLDKDKITYNTKEVPDWFTVVLKLSEPCITSSLKTVLPQIHDILESNSQPKIDLHNILHTSSELPCGCELNDNVPDAALTEEDYSADTRFVKLLVSSLAENVNLLPISLTYLLEKVSEDHPCNARVSARPGTTDTDYSLLYAVLSWCICKYISDRQWLNTHIINGQMSDSLYDTIIKSQPLLHSILTEEDCAGLTDDHLHWLDENQDWVDCKLRHIYSRILHRESLVPDLDVDGNSADQFNQLNITSITHNLIQTSQGRDYLRMLFNLLHNNKDWIFSSLGLKQPDEIQAGLIPFTADISDKFMTKKKNESNPLLLYKSFPSQPINFPKLLTHEYDWSELLQSDLGLTDLSLINCIRRRFEFYEEGGQLTSEERKFVQALRTKLNIGETQHASASP